MRKTLIVNKGIDIELKYLSMENKNGITAYTQYTGI